MDKPGRMLFVVILITMGCTSMNGKIKTGQYPGSLDTEIEGEDGTARKARCQYLLYLPEDYARDEDRWPLMLFLHGAGERGKDLDKVKVHGPPMKVGKGDAFPFVLVSPQCPEGVWWSVEVLCALLDEVISKYRIDEERIYLTGLSMGGFGTWSLAMARPEQFAAIAPICGGGEPDQVHRIKEVPVWAFHGAKDGVVPLQKSEEMVRALEACGGEVKLTVYPEAAHDSWTETYDNPDLYAWFLEQ